MEETLRGHLTVLADAFEAATSQRRAAIGRSAINDNKFFARIEAGGGFTVATYDRLCAWFAENWPKDTSWPAGVTRPEVSHVNLEPEPVA